jgi:hypothetical protein
MRSLADSLSLALRLLPEDAPVYVALSGGLDSWAIALLLRRLGYTVRGLSLVTGIPGYCEADRVQQLAGRFQMPLEAVPSSLEAMEAALPRFLAATRTPIYNLHPVSKLLLAEAAAARRIPLVVTGDAADQVFRCERDCDLLPLTQACFAHCGVALATPFLAPEVRALCVEPDPGKQLLRALAAELGLPPIPKRPTLVPGESILARTREMLCAASLG